MNPIFNRWTLSVAFLVGLAVAFFWYDAVEHSTDSVSTILSNGEAPIALSDQALATLGGVYFEGSYDAHSPGSLSALDIVAKGEGAYAVSTRLDDVTAHGFYPNLFVTMNASDGKPIRTIVLTPQHYQHSMQIADGPILLAVATRTGEQRIRVRASYVDPRPIH